MSLLSTTRLTFQSTCPARGTTAGLTIHYTACQDFNPRAPRGARLYTSSHMETVPAISIHVPREGHDRRPSAPGCCCGISIHVPREGHDPESAGYPRGTADFNPRAPRGARRTGTRRRNKASSNFNPRAPRGARHRLKSLLAIISGFQSTCPARGTTKGSLIREHRNKISIHVPREGHDIIHNRRKKSLETFQSTCPARGTT